MPNPKNINQYSNLYHELLAYAETGTNEDLELETETFGQAERMRVQWHGFYKAIEREANGARIQRNEEAAKYWAARANLAGQWFIRTRLMDGRARPNKAAGESYQIGPAIATFHHRGADTFELKIREQLQRKLEDKKGTNSKSNIESKLNLDLNPPAAPSADESNTPAELDPDDLFE